MVPGSSPGGPTIIKHIGRTVCGGKRQRYSQLANVFYYGDIMKLYEATIRVNGREFKDRVGANTAEEARLLLQQRHGPRAVPYLPHVIPS